MQPKRVVVWGTGVVGTMVITEIMRSPAFELVGVGVSNPAKVGRDAGEICGIDPTGVIATDSVEELVALRPDALVHYGPARSRTRLRGSTRSPRPARRVARPASPPASTPASPTTCSR